MKSKELIAQLLKIDPSGEIEVIGTHGDILATAKLPWYYDGTVNILLRDKNHTESCDVIGLKQLREGQKIILYEMSMEDVMTDHYDDADFVVDGDEKFTENINTFREIFAGMNEEV